MTKSIISSHLQQLAGSGNQLEHVIIERCLACAYSEYPPGYKPPSKHIVIAPSIRQTTLSWKPDGTGKRVWSGFSPKDLIINPSGCFAHCQWEQETQFIMAGINPDSIVEVCDELEVPEVDVPQLFHFRDGAMSRTLQRLMSCFEAPTFSLLEAQSLERMLIQRVVGKCRKIDDQKNHQLSKPKFARVHDFIQDRLAETITLPELAAVAGYSASRFLLLFRNTTGFSPHQYVMQQRLEKAAQLLSRTPLSVSAIPAECGFADQSHLIRLFKRHTGLTPGQFRDQHSHGRRSAPGD